MKVARAALACVLLACIAITLHQAHTPNLADFKVYETAAAVVDRGQSPHIYDDADNGQDPQERVATPTTVFAKTAQSLGIEDVRLYVYPPALADLMTPFGFAQTRVAGQLWLTINALALLLVAVLVCRLLDLKLLSISSGVVLLGLLSIFPTGYCLIYGQVTIALLLLWTAGIYFYHRGWLGASAAMLALAAAVKLTPLLAIGPFLIWREWRWLRNYLLSLVAILAAMLAINGPQTLLDYVRAVVPSMAGGIADYENKTISSAVQLFYASLHGARLIPCRLLIPHGVLTLGKAISALSIVVALALVFRVRKDATLRDRGLTLALFALLSACVAPVSWPHAYIVEFLPLTLLWAQLFRKQVSVTYLCCLTFASIELGSYVLDSAAKKLLHGPLLGAASFAVPITGILLVVLPLAQMSSHKTSQSQELA